MEASSVQEALSLLYAAQCNSSNWTSDQHGHMTPVPNNAHFFVRIVLYDAIKQQMSTLHVIDLAGNQRLSRYQSDRSSQKHQEKLAINQQLLNLSKLVSELSRLSTSPGQLPLYSLVFACTLLPFVLSTLRYMTSLQVTAKMALPAMHRSHLQHATSWS